MLQGAALLIEMIGGLFIVGYALAGVWALLHGPVEERLTSARLLVTEGALAGLSLKVAATLLKPLELQTWHQIGLFAVTFALRTVLKRLFTWEQTRLTAERDRNAQPTL